MSSPHSAAERAALRDRIVRYRAEEDLPREDRASRISAYVYGNIIVFATLVPLTEDEVNEGHALWVTLGVAFTTYLAHVFAELVGRQSRTDDHLVWDEFRHELRDSVPVLTSGLVPAALLAAAWLDLLPATATLVAAEIFLLLRLAAVGFAIERIRGEVPSFRTFGVGIVLAVVAGGIAVLKAFLGH
jgi:hypothetical protein